MQLSSFLTYVKYDFKRTDKDTEITQAYNDAIIHVASIMPHGGYKYQSYLSLVALQEDYPLPSTIMHLIHPVRLLEGSSANDSGYPLRHCTKQKYDILYPNPNRSSPPITGIPVDYCVYSGSILVGPLPQSGTDDLIEIDWTKVPTDQSATTDTPDLPDYWRIVLKPMTMFRLYHGLGLFQEAASWKSLYEDEKGNPIGEFARLLQIEEDKEDNAIGQIKNNNL